VWQQRRSETEPFGTLEFGRDFGSLLRARPENVFVIKMTYWIAR
jgi:hypothetical protein